MSENPSTPFAEIRNSIKDTETIESTSPIDLVEDDLMGEILENLNNSDQKTESQNDEEIEVIPESNGVKTFDDVSQDIVIESVEVFENKNQSSFLMESSTKSIVSVTEVEVHESTENSTAINGNGLHDSEDKNSIRKAQRQSTSRIPRFPAKKT